MKPKKLLLLGGLRYLLPVIEAAHKIGCYVITCDYIPENIAHKFSDKYINENIVDKEAILKIAKIEKIDGILSFAVDPGVLTAAYVAQELGIPTPPYSSVEILQNKALFREFLTQNNFNVPRAKGFRDLRSAQKGLYQFKLPVIVKPVDAAGSKGVSKVNQIEQLPMAFEVALANSINAKEVIVEEFIESKGYPSDTDSFSVNNDLCYISFNSQFFNSKAENPYTPSAYCWPAKMEENHQEELAKELQRLVKLLNLGTSIYNIETRVGTCGKPYIMEVSPRGGGNRLAEVLYKATGTSLIMQTVKAAVGLKVEQLEMPKYDGYWGLIILHSEKEGYFENLVISPTITKESVIEIDLWVQKGDKVNSFRAANDSIGTVILKFSSQQELDLVMRRRDELIKIVVK